MYTNVELVFLAGSKRTVLQQLQVLTPNQLKYIDFHFYLVMYLQSNHFTVYIKCRFIILQSFCPLYRQHILISFFSFNSKSSYTCKAEHSSNKSNSKPLNHMNLQFPFFMSTRSLTILNLKAENYIVSVSKRVIFPIERNSSSVCFLT